MAWAPEEQNTEGCWLWAGGKTAAGYGQRYVDGVNLYVHRVSYETFVGPIPDGYQIDHRCRVRACYNPAHLEAVTQAENVRRQPNVIALAGRTHCPQGHPLDGVKRKGAGTVRRCLTCHRERRRYRAKAAS